MKLLQRFKKHDSLTEMSLADKNDIDESYIYKLSMYEGIEWFQHIILISSYQDYYVPHYSARCEYVEHPSMDAKKKNTLKKMANNIISRINSEA